MDRQAMARVQRAAAFSSNHILEAQSFPEELSTIENGYVGQIEKTINKSYYNARAIHHFYRPEIEESVDEVIGNGVAREKAWAAVLNTVLTSSVNDAAYKHLMGRERTSVKVAQTAVLSITGLAAAFSSVVSHPEISYELLGVIGGGYAMLVGVDGLMMQAVTQDDHMSKRRWSVNPFGRWQPDRYAATLALNKFHPLIQYRQ